jgi:hypothetical protein
MMVSIYTDNNNNRFVLLIDGQYIYNNNNRFVLLIDSQYMYR